MAAKVFFHLLYVGVFWFLFLAWNGYPIFHAVYSLQRLSNCSISFLSEFISNRRNIAIMADNSLWSIPIWMMYTKYIRRAMLDFCFPWYYVGNLCQNRIRRFSYSHMSIFDPTLSISFDWSTDKSEFSDRIIQFWPNFVCFL